MKKAGTDFERAQDDDGRSREAGISRRDLLVLGAGAIALAGCGPTASGKSHMRSATAITEVFGEGQKFTAIAIGYDRPIAGSSLAISSFAVAGRTVAEVFASASADPAGRADSGSFVIVRLSPDDSGSTLKIDAMKGGGPPAGGAPGGKPSGPPPGMGPAGSKPQGPGQTYRTPSARVAQSGPISTVDGTIYPASAVAIATGAVRNLIVDDFRQFVFRDPRTGDTLKYNLFIPKGYDPDKRYPLVLFMHDAGVTGPDPTATLRQGLGAVVWASPEEQAKHPAFVLAPQYETIIVDDSSTASSALDTTIDLINDLASRYGIDRDRLYTTGQSGGAMMSLAMDIKYPAFFAASLIVAGQWAPDKVRPLASQKLWIIVSQGDLKAYPGENAITAVLQQSGTKVARAVWNGTWNASRFASAVSAIEAEHAPINYVALRKGTVVPAGQDDNGGSNHVNTWRIAYTIGGVRDWLFAQHKMRSPA
jgi:predicted peptidase